MTTEGIIDKLVEQLHARLDKPEEPITPNMDLADIMYDAGRKLGHKEVILMLQRIRSDMNASPSSL